MSLDNYDENEDDYDDEDDERIKVKLNKARIIASKLESSKSIMENAGHTAILMKYLFNSTKLNVLLFYAVVEKFKSVTSSKNSMRNFNHLNNEIFSVFLHNKSPLYIRELENYPILLESILKNINDEECIECFTNLQKNLIDDIISRDSANFRSAILNLTENYPIDNQLDKDLTSIQELKLLKRTQKLIDRYYNSQMKSRCLPNESNQDFTRETAFLQFHYQALKIAFNTQMEYFLLNSRYNPIFKNSNNPLLENRGFLSSIYSKQLKKYRVNGHLLCDNSPASIQFCPVCTNILWGSFPQGLICQNCSVPVHIDCKDAIDTCWFDNRKIKRSESRKEKVQTPVKKPSLKGFEGFKMIKNKLGFNEESQQSPEVKPINIEGCSRVSSRVIEIHDSDNVELINDCIFEDDNLVKSAPSRSQCGLENDMDDKIRNLPGIKHVKSMNSSNSNNKNLFEKNNTNKMSSNSGSNDVFRSKSTRTPSPDSPSFFQNKFQSRSIESRRNSSYLPCISMEFDQDSDMDISETFDLEVELKSLASFDKKSHSEAAFKRICVLLEFHHKLRFIRMIIKRFQILIVIPWRSLSEYMELFESMSLHCLDEFYVLLNDLVGVMDKCRKPSEYDKCTANFIYQWLIQCNQANLEKWYRLCVEFLCTNNIYSVKAHWLEHQRSTPALSKLLSQKINRIDIMDQLVNVRPLLFSLPMIVNKIINDLNQFPQYKDEYQMWENILNLFNKIPIMLDRRCMPIVKLINDDLIINSLSKYKLTSDSGITQFIYNFPKSIFQNGFCDFQFIKISNIREFKDGEAKSMTIYIREDLSGAAILYDSKLVILQQNAFSSSDCRDVTLFFKYFKCSNQTKIIPVFKFNEVHLVKQNVKDSTDYRFELTVILVSQAILIQIRFKDENIRDMWFNRINSRNLSSNYLNTNNINLVNLDYFTDDNYPQTNNSAESITCSDKINRIQTAFCEASNSLTIAMNLIDDELNLIKFTQKINSDYSNPIIMLRQMANTISQYSQLCSTMIGQSQALDKSLLIQRDIVTFHSSNISHFAEMTNQMARSIEEDIKSDEEEGENVVAAIDNIQVDETKEESHDFLNTMLDKVQSKAQTNKVQPCTLLDK